MSAIGQAQMVKHCIEEAMRLYPPVYVIDRVSLEDDTIKNRSFEKGTVWLMSMYELHRSKKFWRKPEDFDPTRFNELNSKDYSDFYYPFGAGPRMCVGNNFAIFEMIMVISTILKDYRVSATSEKVEINPLISLKPQNVFLKLEKR